MVLTADSSVLRADSSSLPTDSAVAQEALYWSHQDDHLEATPSSTSGQHVVVLTADSSVLTRDSSLPTDSAVAQEALLLSLEVTGLVRDSLPSDSAIIRGLW